MSNPKDFTKTKLSMSVMNAIQHRRSVRDYTSQAIGEKVIRTLLDAAVHAPTAMHEEPWSFAVNPPQNVREWTHSAVAALHRRDTTHGCQ